MLDAILDRSVKNQSPLFKHDRPAAKGPDCLKIVTDEKYGAAVASRCIVQPRQRFTLESDVADRENLVNDENLWLQKGCYRECQAHIHSGGIALDRCINELFDFGEGHDLVELPGDLGARDESRFRPRAASRRARAAAPALRSAA